jgi:hypothetical protein
MTKRSSTNGQSAAEIAQRQEHRAKIRALLADREMFTVDIALAVGVAAREAYSLLNTMHGAGEIRSAGTRSRRLGNKWMLDLDQDTTPEDIAAEREGQVRIVNARQIGIARHWMDVALFGPAGDAGAAA